MSSSEGLFRVKHHLRALARVPGLLLPRPPWFVRGVSRIFFFKADILFQVTNFWWGVCLWVRIDQNTSGILGVLRRYPRYFGTNFYSNP